MFKSTVCTSFGRIQFFVTYNFCGVPHSLTFISWYGNLGIDEDSGLNYVYANISNDLCSVVDTSKVAGPLLHCHDGSDRNKIWILNYKFCS